MRYFILASFITIVGCASPQQNIATGEFKFYTTIVVTEEWCYMPDKKTKVNGVTNYNTLVRSVSSICVGLKSDDPERTLQHELVHAWRNAVGLDARWVGHNNVCTAGTC